MRTLDDFIAECQANPIGDKDRPPPPILRTGQPGVPIPPGLAEVILDMAQRIRQLSQRVKALEDATP